MFCFSKYESPTGRWVPTFLSGEDGAVGLSERLSNHRESVDNSLAFIHQESEIFYVRETI